ncbi:MAG: redox-sensing transcriptional repressor Rex [Ruminococcus sp.]|nr:redox-sensing transcriptional repressor Rex [Ruminococcus sp.]
MSRNITSQTLQRLPLYLNYLKSLPQEKSSGNISATAVAEALCLNDVQVRKDLASVSSGGRPKVGYVTRKLIDDIEKFLGSGSCDGVIVAGAGNLGRALLAFNGFGDYGLDIVAGFDCDENIIGTMVNGKPVLALSEMDCVCRKNNVHIGIITVPETAAQAVCDVMVKAGITEILNFAPVHLNAPAEVTIQNQNIAISLAMLSRHLI